MDLLHFAGPAIVIGASALSSPGPAAAQTAALWCRGDTLIDLRTNLQPHGAGSAVREKVEIVYLPTTAGDAGKL
jgi:hypothetical protein